MKMEQKRRKIESLLVLLLFLIFSVCILSVLLDGADIYQKLIQKDQTSYEKQTAIQYLTTKVHQSDIADALSVERMDGLDILSVTEEIEGKIYKTQIYCYDGYIRELFASEAYPFSPKDGEKILEAKSLSFDLQRDVLNTTITFSDGAVQSFCLYFRSGKELSGEK